MNDWLKNRLSPVKIDTNRWTELAEAIQELWSENFDDDLARYISLRSIYEANEDDQKWIQAELGKYYEDEIPTLNIPLAVQRRELELSQKGTENPFQYTLARLGLNAEWVPIYAPKTGGIYGDGFVRATESVVYEVVKLDGSHQIDGTWQVGRIKRRDLPGEVQTLDGYFLTSRGVIVVSLGDESVSEEVGIIRRRMIQTKPIWIVFDGVVYIVETAIQHDHEMEAVGQLTGTSKLSGFDCPLKLDGTWGLGRVIRVDGSWAVRSTPHPCTSVCLGQTHQDKIVNRLEGSWTLDGSKQLMCTLIPHITISLCRISTAGTITGTSEIMAGPSVGGDVIILPYPLAFYDGIFGGSAGALPSDTLDGGDAADLPEHTAFGGNA
jgi:hypothetical protein